MLAGVQLSESLKLEAIAAGEFSYAEIPYEIIERMHFQHTEKAKENQEYLRFRVFRIH